MTRYADIDLDAAVVAALEGLVEGIADTIGNVLRDAGLDQPICSICISQGQEEELDVLPVLFAGRVSDRDRIVRESDGDDWAAAWNPFAYRDEADVVHPMLDEDDEEDYLVLEDEQLDAWRRVRDALDGCVDEPSYWVLARVARKLNRTELAIPASQDLAVWLFGASVDENALREQLKFVLTPENFTKLTAAGLIR